jgi:RimJ/RimL family protein N-acetyltransferase
METTPINAITLRPLTSADIDAFIVWGMDDEVTKYLRWKSYQSRQQAEEFFKNVVEKHPWFQAIVVNDVVIGSMTLEQGTGDYRCKAELGYVSARKYWGHGYMTQAVQLAVERGFKEFGVARIEATVHPARAFKKIL